MYTHARTHARKHAHIQWGPQWKHFVSLVLGGFAGLEWTRCYRNSQTTEGVYMACLCVCARAVYACLHACMSVFEGGNKLMADFSPCFDGIKSPLLLNVPR